MLNLEELMHKRISILLPCLALLLSIQGCGDSFANDADIQAVKADYFGPQRTATIGDSLE